MLATASSLYARMSADHPGSLPDDDAYWSSLPAHLRQFIRNALPLGHLQSNNHHNPPKMSAAAMQAVAQQIASATRYPPNNNSSNNNSNNNSSNNNNLIQGIPHGPAPPPPTSSFDFSDPSVRFALEQLGPPPNRSITHDNFDQDYYSDDDVDSIDGTDGDYSYHSGVIYDSGVIPLTTQNVNHQSNNNNNNISNNNEVNTQINNNNNNSSKKKKNKKKKKSQDVANIPPPPPPPPAQPVPPPPVNQPPPPSSRAAGKAPMSYLPQTTMKSNNNFNPSTKTKLSQSNLQHQNNVNQKSSLLSSKKIWSTNSSEERERIKEFWLSLSQSERKNLVEIEKDTVLRKMKEQQKHSCSCAVCGRKRSAIEDELQVLYDAYYDELEQYVNHQHQHYINPNSIPPPPGPGPFPGSVELDKNGQLIQPIDHQHDDDDDLDDDYDEDDDDDYEDEDGDEDLSNDDEFEDDNESIQNNRRFRHSNRIINNKKKPEIFTSSFSKTFTVQGA